MKQTFRIELATEVAPLTERALVAYLNSERHCDRGEIIAVTNVSQPPKEDVDNLYHQAHRALQHIENVISWAQELKTKVGD